MLENLEKITDFKYGENTHQGASLYKIPEIIDYEILNEKELLYKDILNMTTLVNVLSEFFDVNATVIIKDAMICGAALGKTLKEAFSKAFDCNPVSSINACIGFSKILDEDTAKQIYLSEFKMVVAPGFDKEALNILKKKESLKIIKINTPLEEIKILQKEEVKITPFGILVQDANRIDFNKDTFKVQGTKKPTVEQIEDAIFAYKIAKHAKSNASVVAKDFKTLAIGQGQTSYSEAVEWCINFACDGTKDAVLVTDIAIETLDGIHLAAQGRISMIMHSGGTFQDKTIATTCDKYQIALVTTGISHFRA